ncbi:NAD(P)-dependent oxidoreductase [Streptomyces kanasensis]|uniref:NAD(P)-dependent oxidoreductase n=1 Tax=Streptomyces kanasensis TaxID=936756 RepID=UPI0036F77F8C
MKIALFGATGMVGSRIAAEAARRGHDVVAVSRSGASPVEGPGVTAVAADAGSVEAVAAAVAGADVVASALAPVRDGSDPRAPFAALYDAFLDGVRQGGVRRVVIVGGAGSLLVEPGTALVDTPGFPVAYKAEAQAHADRLAALRGVTDLDWTYVSPAAQIAPGERTGVFRVGGDALLTDAEGNSAISAEDYAVAFVDEIERGAHPGTRISVAY